MRPPRPEPPVVFRPHPLESLSSWVVRMAGVYHVDAGTLLSERTGAPMSLPRLDLQPSLLVLERVSQLTRWEMPQLRRHTLAGSHPHWLPHWVTLQPLYWHINNRASVAREGVLFGYCHACLSEDLEGGGQFFRLEWLCAVTTVCRQHAVALSPCAEMNPHPFDCRHTRAGARFFCRFSGEPLDSRCFRVGSQRSLTLLACFEEKIRRALSTVALGGIISCQLLAAVEDLVWALLQPIAADGTRLLHCLETTAFPTPRGWRTPPETFSLCRADLALRRALLSAIAYLLEPQAFACWGREFCHRASARVYSELLDLLGPWKADLLLSKAHRWPAQFRSKMPGAVGRTSWFVY